MRRSEAIEKLADAMVEFQEDPEGLMNFLENTLGMHKYKYISSGCLCGHFDVCHCGPGRYEVGWKPELPTEQKFNPFERNKR